MFYRAGKTNLVSHKNSSDYKINTMRNYRTAVALSFIWTLCLWPIQSQIFFEGSFDPIVLVDSKRVRGGNLNYSFESGIKAKNGGEGISLFIESFKALEYLAYGGKFDYQFNFQLIDVKIGPEIGYSKRREIEEHTDFKYYKPILFYGANLKVKTKNLYNFYLFSNLNARRRTDISYYYNTGKQNWIVSGFVGVGYQL